MRLLAQLPNDVTRHLETKGCLIEEGAIKSCYPIIDENLPEGPLLVAFDENTWDAAGRAVTDQLDSHDRAFETFKVTAEADEDHPICTDRRIDEFTRKLRQTDCDAGLAVGSGTINDIVKMGSYQANAPMGVIGTAPSMNGYTSGIAAVLSDGVKTSVPCQPPQFVVADVEVMAEAPYRMLCSGLGDLLSKPVSNADWQMSALLKGTPHSKKALQIIEDAEDALEGVAERLPQRERDAVQDLIRSLILSGVAMAVAGSSSPASGGEHLISHYIDMTGHAHHLPMDLHGCQVGVGTVTSAYLYEKLENLDPEAIEPKSRADKLPAWETYAETLEDRFGPLYEAVREHASGGYPTKDELADRLTDLKSRWDEILPKVTRTLRTSCSIRAQLQRAEAPTRFRDLGIEKERATKAILHSKDIRDRYTVLHLLWELGRLDEWGQQAVDDLY